MIDVLLRPEPNVVYSMAAVPLRLNDVPEFAIGAGQDTRVRRLSAAFRENNRVMEDDLKQGRCRSRCGLLLLSLSAVGGDRG